MPTDMPIKVYTTPTCPYCHMLKAYLKQRKVEFLEVDLSKDTKAAMYIIEKSGQMGVPQTEINGKIIIGFDEDAIERELKVMPKTKAKA